MNVPYKMCVDMAEKPKALLIMLEGRALQYYYDHLQGKLVNLDDLCGSIRRRLLSEEHTRGIMRKWDYITLESIMSENGGKKATVRLDSLVASLEDIQSGLTKNYHKEIFLKNELLNGRGHRCM